MENEQIKTTQEILMDKKLRENTNLCVGKNEQQATSKGETWSRGTNSRLPLDVNVMLNLFICAFKRTGGAGTVSLMAEASFPEKGAVARCLYRNTMVDLLASAILIYTFIASTLTGNDH